MEDQELHRGERTSNSVCSLVDCHKMSHLVELVSSREACRTGADDSNLRG